jgi:hypothetical protein
MSALAPGSQVVMTGLIENDKTDLTKALLEAGFLVGPGVSKKTSALIAGDPDTDSSKARKARDLGLPVFSEAEFIAQYLGGEVAVDLDAETFTAPVTAADIIPTGKRDPKALKAVLAGIRDGMPLQATLKIDGQFVVVRGKVIWSELAGAWLLAGLPLGTKTAVDTSLHLLGLAGGTPGSLGGATLAEGAVIEALFRHPVYGTFTISGTVIASDIGQLTLGSWLPGAHHCLEGTLLG